VSGGGLALPAAGAVSGETVAFAAGLTGRSGRAPVIEAALAKATGRPRPLPVRAVLIALLCLALGDRPLFLTEATRLLFCQLGDTSRALHDRLHPPGDPPPADQPGPGLRTRPRDVWSWSRWRRRRQYQARLCHYRRRGYALT